MKKSLVGLVAGAALLSGCATSEYATNVHSDLKRSPRTNNDAKYASPFFTSEGEGYQISEKPSKFKIGDRVVEGYAVLPIKGSNLVVGHKSETASSEPSKTYAIVHVDVKDGKYIIAPEGSTERERIPVPTITLPGVKVPKKGFGFGKITNKDFEYSIDRMNIGGLARSVLRTALPVEGQEALPLVYINDAKEVVPVSGGTLELDGYAMRPVRATPWVAPAPKPEQKAAPKPVPTLKEAGKPKKAPQAVVPGSRSVRR